MRIDAGSHPALFRALLDVEYDHGAVNRLEPEPDHFIVPARFDDHLLAIDRALSELPDWMIEDFVSGFDTEEYFEWKPMLRECSELLDAVFDDEGICEAFDRLA